MAKAVRAKCLDCICYPGNGRMDCEIPGCSLYYWMPYRKLAPDLKWLEESNLRSQKAPQAQKKDRAEGTRQDAPPEPCVEPAPFWHT